MRLGLRKGLLALAAAILASGCSIAPVASHDVIVNRIADDAAAFNEAYAHAVTGQILLNILRSRDRQPRYYLSTTGISDAPLLDDQASLNIGSLGLGRAFDPWGIGSFGVRRETSRRPSYALQPLSAETLIKSVFLPTPNNVFEHYWRSGWPRDMLGLLMIERITRVENGVREEFDNEANNIASDCAANVSASGCAFVTALRGMLTAMGDQRPAADAANGAASCGLIDAFAPRTPVRHRAPAVGEVCTANFIVGGATYYLDLRSFDDIVYYVGELMRLSYTQTNGDPNAVLDAPVKVSVAGLRGGGQGVPLFRILPEGAASSAAEGKPRDAFAASVLYGGKRYFAGKAVGRACADASGAGLCVDAVTTGDRSSSVLSLLAELLALNQSPDAIRAPGRLLTE
jgi:hypothetical protein